MNAPVLQVRNLRVSYYTERGAVRAVQDLSVDLNVGERLGLVGESGSGKSTMALALMRLLKPPARIEGGEIWIGGAEGTSKPGGRQQALPGPGDDIAHDAVDLLQLGEEEMRRQRLARIALIAQGSMNSLNPVLPIRDQIVDGLVDHEVRGTSREMDERVRSLLGRVGLRPEVAGMFPHELSGGMKQRACIAIAISLNPSVIIADEPTSALDVVVQRQIMETLRRVQTDLGASVLLVGHDMGLMAQAVDRLGVMYAGRLMEVAPVAKVFYAARHPYSQMLIASLPSLDRKGEFRGIPGLPPSLAELPPGCPFAPRCPWAIERCHTEVPALRSLEPDWQAACHLA